MFSLLLCDLEIEVRVMELAAILRIIRKITGLLALPRASHPRHLCAYCSDGCVALIYSL